MKSSIKIIKFVILFLLISVSGKVFSQDILYSKGKGAIQCIVLEIGINEIKYKNFNNQDGPVIVTRKDEIYKIKYKNGTEEVITPDLYSVHQESQILHKTRSFKFHVFSPLMENLSFSYEKVVRVGFNVEGTIGIIGPGWTTLNNGKSSGVYFQGAAKYLLGSEVVMDGMRYAHPLKGKFFRFDLSYSHFNVKDVNLGRVYNQTSTYPYSSSYTEIKSDIAYNSVAFNICFGKQYVLGNQFTLEYYFGLGYGFESEVLSNPPVSTVQSFSRRATGPYRYSHNQYSDELPITSTGGVSIGYIF